MKKLYFYTTAGCHLCEQAEEILRTLPKKLNVSWESVDISESDILISRYGTRIPVLHVVSTGMEKGWPFSKEEILNWLQSD